MGGTSLEAQVSQAFNNGNAEIVWNQGAAMTAKEEGLWDPVPNLPGLMPVTKEDIRHMQNRCHQFNALVPVPEDDMVTVPTCKESFCRWLVCESSQFAARVVPRPMRRLQGRALPPLPDQAASVQLPVAEEPPAEAAE